MSKENQIDTIIDLLTEFDEMGFIPTTTVPDPEAYAIKWRERITKAFEEYRKQSEDVTDINVGNKSADVVEVVRCKDCICRVEFDTNRFHCTNTGYYCGETGYCSDGVRKSKKGGGITLYDHEDQGWKTCPICGKGFLLAPEHALTDYHGNFVCSPGCNAIAFHREQKKKEINKKVKRKARCTKPVLVVKKEGGAVMSRHESMTAAAEATGFSIPYISTVCNGYRETLGAYTFRFENHDGSPEEIQAIWNRRPARKAVVQLNLRGEFIARYDSQKEAVEKTGCNQSAVSQCCLHMMKQTKGFLFMFESEYEEKKGNNNDENYS